MKKTFSLIVLAFLMVPAALAISPADGWLWRGELAAEKIVEFFNPASVQVHAQERIQEYNLMVEQNMVAEAYEAREQVREHFRSHNMNLSENDAYNRVEERYGAAFSIDDEKLDSIKANVNLALQSKGAQQLRFGNSWSTGIIVAIPEGNRFFLAQGSGNRVDSLTETTSRDVSSGDYLVELTYGEFMSLEARNAAEMTPLLRRIRG